VDRCGVDVLLRRINTDNGCAKARHGLADQAAAAADIEDAQSLERMGQLLVETEMRAQLLVNIGKAHRVELVQHAELALRVPPLGRQSGKARNLIRVDGADWGGGAGCAVRHERECLVRVSVALSIRCGLASASGHMSRPSDAQLSVQQKRRAVRDDAPSSGVFLISSRRPTLR
jgi:hypothetical protein